MRSALAVTPNRACTPSAALQGGSAACQHSFATAGRPHYCSYIHPAELVATLHPAKTSDEQLVISYLGACVLWWHLQWCELAAVRRVLDSVQPLSAAQEQLALQRLERCIALSHTMQRASALVRRYLIIPAPSVEVFFHVKGELPAIPLVRDLDTLTAHLQASNAFRVRGPLSLASNRLQEYVAVAADSRHVVEQLLATFQDHSQPEVALEALLPEGLLAWSKLTMQRHHPQALSDVGATRPRVFIGSHEQFEVFFPVTICALEEAITHLTLEPAHVMSAASLTQRAADSIELWQGMIHTPQTMTAADYIGVREQLNRGSGAESLQLRCIEIVAGLRHRPYRKRLRKMQLWTPRLEALWQAPSLSSAILQVLAARGVLSLDAHPSAQAAQIASILRPVGTDHHHADLAALCQAALNLDQQLWLWRQHHIAMVRAMIGGKPSIGVGGEQNHQRLARGLLPALISALPASSRSVAEQVVRSLKRPVGGMAYLEQTTRYRLFPLLSLALEYLQENWQAVASTTGRE